MANFLESVFAGLGRVVARHAWASILLSIIISLGIGSGFFVALETENRPERQWVPSTAPALAHNNYVQQAWPSSSRFNIWVAECQPAEGDEEACNVLDAKYTQRLLEIHERIMAITINGTALYENYSSVDSAVWEATYGGMWSFQTSATTEAKCFKFGPFCGQNSLLEVYRRDPPVIANLTDASALTAINYWEKQQTLCPVSIATPGSPCVDTSIYNPAADPNDCQLYETQAQRENCRVASNNYCNVVCPAECMMQGDTCIPVVKDNATCWDTGCLTLQGFTQLETNNQTGAPTNAFAFEPFAISTVASSGEDGPAKSNVTGKIISASALMGYYVLAQNTLVIGGDNVDPVAEEWEMLALCELGITTPRSGLNCTQDDMLKFTPQFTRSLGDEFGATISADVPLLAAAIFSIVIYMAIMLSRRDSVYAMVGMACVTGIIVALSWVAGMGLGAFIGLMNNNLNNNIPFLLLGLGVDDAFVLVGEYQRSRRLNPKNSIEDNIVEAARHGGVSILITSLTDALAFLVGSVTVLPALSWFCAFAGLGIIFCFLLQIFLFLPALYLNAKRAAANRLDFFCCFHASTEHDYDNPAGCCGCCNCKPDILPALLRRFGEWATSGLGLVATLLVFTGLLGAGIYGFTQIYKDFKLEWFVPDDSYLNEFYSLNDQYFATGTQTTIYIKDIDYYGAQSNMTDLGTFINTTSYVDHDENTNDWFAAFITDSRTGNDTAALVSPAGTYTNETAFYTQLHLWYKEGGGVRYRNNLQWMDSTCEDDLTWDACSPTSGLNASRVSFSLTLAATNLGQDRYNTMTALRNKCNELFTPVNGEDMAFPFNFQFLYWEEVGVIDGELWRNLGICGGIIAGIVLLLIPNLRVAPLVIVCIVATVVEVVGFMYFWNVTISGVSTIYLLICVGLAVDYAAHIAHIFTVSTGTARERAVSALERIGPSTFNAVVSTLVAVVVLAFSKSYVFRIFFKALFLVVLLGGANGLWLLPALLSLFGGSKDEAEFEDNGAMGSGSIKMSNLSNKSDLTGKRPKTSIAA